METKRERVFVKPAKDGLIVRHPDTKRPLKKEGEQVIKSSYWLRRLKEGSIVMETKTAAKPKAAPAKTEQKDGGKS